MQAKGGALKSSAREAFFLDFAHEIRAKFPSVVLMLTGKETLFEIHVPYISYILIA